LKEPTTYPGIKGRLIAWIEDFLSNRNIKVSFQGCYSDPHTVNMGASERSSRSPTLFNALVILLSISLPPCLDILAYTDDLAIVSHGDHTAKKNFI